MLHLDAFLPGNLIGQGYELQIVSLVHIWEPRTCREVLAAQRMLGEEVDMIGENHQVADLELRVHATGGVADEECLDAQFIHHPDGEGHFLHRITLVEVEPALHGEDVHATELTEDQLAAVPFNR